MRRDPVTQWLLVGFVAVVVGLAVKLLGAPSGYGLVAASVVVVAWWLFFRQGAREAQQAAVLRGWAAERRRQFVAAPERPTDAAFLTEEHVDFRNAIIGDGMYLSAFVCSTGSGEAEVAYEYTIAISAANFEGAEPFTFGERLPEPAATPVDAAAAAAPDYGTQRLDDPRLRDRFQLVTRHDQDPDAISRVFSTERQAALAALAGNSFLHWIECTGTALLVASPRHLSADTVEELDAESRAVLAVFLGDELRWPPVPR